MIEDCVGKVSEYIKHRDMRESQIVAALRELQTPSSPMQIVKIVYVGTPEHLHRAAEA